MKNWIMTASGKDFDLDNPYGFEYDIEDIANSLAKICRFNGHINDFYSVAQHSVLTSVIAPIQLQKAALLHDAAEAFIGDVATPLKAMLPEYKDIEQRIERDIFHHFGLSTVYLSQIKHWDLVMLATEKRDLYDNENDNPWPVLEGIEPHSMKIVPWQWEYAKDVFIERFNELFN